MIRSRQRLTSGVAAGTGRSFERCASGSGRASARTNTRAT